MSKQTAVEWLVEEIHKNGEEIHKNGNWIPTHMIDQAKQMEREQIIGAYDRDVIGGIQNWFIGNGEKYYNLHYMGNKEEPNPKPDQNYTFEDGV